MKKTSWFFGFALVVGTGILVIVQAGDSSAIPRSREGVREETRENQGVELADVAGILETHIQKRVGDRRKRIEVKDIRGFETFVLPPGNLSYDVVIPDHSYRGGTVSASILFLVDGKEVKKMRVTAQVHIFTDVVVARSHLKKNQVIQEKDLQLVNKNISVLAPDVMTDFEEVVGKRTTLTMNGQEVFRKSMVERVPLVKKGDRITLIVENSRFRITSVGEVQEEGGKGERVRLLNVSSKREVYGRILDANTAQVDY
jgi:flagella basal body P-ring formation protein FlgA